MTPALLPAVDPSPLPAPAWLFQALLLATFFVHLLFLNVALGTALIGAVHGVAGAKRGHAREVRAALARILPTALSFTITTGVAPLLFVQVLYAQVFYPATILVAWAWLALLPLLLLGYAAAYGLKCGRPPAVRAGGWPLVAAGAFLLIAAIQVTVNVLQLTPARWVAVAAGQASALGDGSLLPRLLHFFLGSCAVAGMVLAVFPGAASREGTTQAWVARVGARWALVGTGLQMAGGFWLLFALPLDVLTPLVLGRWPATPLLALSIGLGLLTLLLLTRLDDPLTQRPLARGAAVSLLFTLLGMVLLRDVVRRLCLDGVVRPAALPVQTQPDLVVLFLVVLLLGAITLGWLARRIRADRAGGASPRLDVPR